MRRVAAIAIALAGTFVPFVAGAAASSNPDDGAATSTTLVGVPSSDGLSIDEQSGVTVPPSVVSVSTIPSATTTVPVGCAPPPVSQAVFVGRLKNVDVTSAVFDLVRLRSGSLAGYSTEVPLSTGEVATEVGIYYGRDVKFLKPGESYLVGTSLDAATGRIFSRVTESAPQFGGNQVADINNSGVVCPTFADPAKTLHVDGASIESGVLSGLKDESNRLLLAIIVPSLLVFGALLTLVLIRRSMLR